MDASDLPRHDAGLTLSHNPHKTCYESVQSHTVDFDAEEWVSPEQRQRAIDTDCLWVLMWWPNTPVGSNTLAAADLDVLLNAAKEWE